MVCVGVNHRFTIDHYRNMAFPKDQIAALQGRIIGQNNPQRVLLHIAVAWTHMAAGVVRGLHQS